MPWFENREHSEEIAQFFKRLIFAYPLPSLTSEVPARHPVLQAD